MATKKHESTADHLEDLEKRIHDLEEFKKLVIKRFGAHLGIISEDSWGLQAKKSKPTGSPDF